MTKRFVLIQPQNRRKERVDRRQFSDRRGRSIHEIDITTLRELLQEAHARIRALEQAIATLKQVI